MNSPAQKDYTAALQLEIGRKYTQMFLGIIGFSMEVNFFFPYIQHFGTFCVV